MSNETTDCIECVFEEISELVKSSASNISEVADPRMMPIVRWLLAKCDKKAVNERSLVGRDKLTKLCLKSS